MKDDKTMQLIDDLLESMQNLRPFWEIATGVCSVCGLPKGRKFEQCDGRHGSIQ